MDRYLDISGYNFTLLVFGIVNGEIVCHCKHCTPENGKQALKVAQANCELRLHRASLGLAGSVFTESLFPLYVHIYSLIHIAHCRTT